MTSDHISDHVDQWLVASDGEPAESATAFLVHLKGRDEPVRVEAKYTMPEGDWLCFVNHEYEDTYAPDDSQTERVAMFPCENVVYVQKLEE